MADKSAIFDSTIAHFRVIEADQARGQGMLIDVHIIAPVWGSSGYYSEAVLTDACKKRVYLKGMHMHLDHPTREAEKNQPARTLAGESPLAAIFTEDGHYEKDGWDKTQENPTGAGVYTVARVLPKFEEDIRAMAGHIGISHYVDGIAEEGTAPDGRKGMIIKELRPSPLNTVDFVTVPGAEGHYRTLFSEMKVRAGQTEDMDRKKERAMADKQESLTLSEVRSKYPEVVTELKEQLKVELKTEEAAKDQSAKLTEAADKISKLTEENTTLKAKIAESKAAEYVKAEIGKAKLPETSAKLLTDSLMKQVPMTESGEVDAPKLAEIVKEAIKVKTDEIAAIRKEAGGDGIRGNGAPAGGNDGDAHKALIESFERAYLSQGKTAEQAKQMAEVAAGGR